MKRVFSILLAFILLFSISLTAFATDRTTVKENENIAVVKNIITEKEKKVLEALPVEIKAKSAVLMDVASGEILLEYNPDKKLFPASVTKIMTMLLVAEAVNAKKITLADMVTCSKNAASKGGSQIWLEEGERMSVDELLRATVIGSANDAATLLGEYVAGSEAAFINMMNSRAKELKMNNTNFENATGLDDSTDTHLTTARDIAIMSCELLKYDFITDYTTVWMDSLRGGKTELVNTNKLVRFYSGTTGLKTGTTAKAGCCISASAKRDNLHLVAVVMGSNSSTDRFETAKAMLEWGFSNYKSVVPEINLKKLQNVRVVGGTAEAVECKLPEIKPMLVKKQDESGLKASVKISQELSAPVKKNQVIGKIIISLDENEVAEYKITAQNAVEKLGFFGCVKKLAFFLANGSYEAL